MALIYTTRRCHRKTTNAVGISRASVSAIIKRVSTFSGPEPIKLPTIVNKVKELTNKFLETHEFPHCIGTKDDTHIEAAELNEHYSNYINRKGYFSLNVQTAC